MPRRNFGADVGAFTPSTDGAASPEAGVTIAAATAPAVQTKSRRVIRAMHPPSSQRVSRQSRAPLSYRRAPRGGGAARGPATMANYPMPKLARSPRLGKRQVQLIANGDLRLSANQKCWPAQAEMEQLLTAAVAEAGHELVRAHPFKPDANHGFIGSQKEGMSVFRANIDPDAPLIVAESVWQYSHHVLHGLMSHRGPILTAANW